MKRRGAMPLFAVAAAIALCLPQAGASGHHSHGGRHGRLLVVDNSGHRRSCLGTRHPFLTIQAAVDAARSGDTIRVCPGLYEENVKVQTPRLTILGANAGKDPTGKKRRHESTVTGVFADDLKGTVQLLADHITWDGFTIRGIPEEKNAPGMYSDPAHSGYLVRDTIFEDNGVGLHLGSSREHPTLICRNRFQLHNEAGIFFAGRGRPQADVLVDHNKSVDDMTFAAIFNTSRVKLSHNSVRARVDDPEFPEPTSGIFIGARNDTVLVKLNRVWSASGNDIDVTESGEPGKPDAAPTGVVVRKNKVTEAQLAGLRMAGGTSKVTVNANTALDNTEWDCKDESTGGTGTAGTHNTWTGNFGGTSSPTGLCAPPPTPDKPDHGKGHHHKKKKKKKDPCACRKHPKAF